MRNRKTNKQLCVICGENNASTGQGDHIPPKSIYSEPERKSGAFQFHTVPACVRCNGAGSKFDEQLKLLIGLSTGDHREFQDDLINTLASTIGRNNRLAREFFSTAQRTTRPNSSGIHVPAVSVDFNYEYYLKSISRIGRAIYWRTSEKILPKSSKIDILDTSRLSIEEFRAVEQIFSKIKPLEINGGTFVCRLATINEKLNLMKMEFFGSHITIIKITAI